MLNDYSELRGGGNYEPVLAIYDATGTGGDKGLLERCGPAFRRCGDY